MVKNNTKYNTDEILSVITRNRSFIDEISNIPSLYNEVNDLLKIYIDNMLDIDEFICFCDILDYDLDRNQEFWLSNKKYNVFVMFRTHGVYFFKHFFSYYIHDTWTTLRNFEPYIDFLSKFAYPLKFKILYMISKLSLIDKYVFKSPPTIIDKYICNVEDILDYMVLDNVNDSKEFLKKLLNFYYSRFRFSHNEVNYKVLTDYFENVISYSRIMSLESNKDCLEAYGIKYPSIYD